MSYSEWGREWRAGAGSGFFGVMCGDGVGGGWGITLWALIAGGCTRVTGGMNSGVSMLVGQKGCRNREVQVCGSEGGGETACKCAVLHVGHE